MSLKQEVLEHKISVPETFYKNAQIYTQHLLKWNKIHNLTGAKDETTIQTFIFDAIFPLTFLPDVKNILDIGTGAGFPGMILALALPATQVTLVEPLKKRASFLQFVKADLNLENVTVVNKRVEEMDAKIFELITSRAVTDTKMLLELSKNFRNESSLLLFYKGEKVFEEVTNLINHKIIQDNKRHYLLMGENV